MQASQRALEELWSGVMSSSWDRRWRVGFYSPEGFPTWTGFGLLRVKGVFYCPLITMAHVKYDGMCAHLPMCLGTLCMLDMVNIMFKWVLHCVSQEAHL